MKKITKYPETKLDHYRYHLILWRTIYDFLKGLTPEEVLVVWDQCDCDRENYNYNGAFEALKSKVFGFLFNFEESVHAYCFLCEWESDYRENLVCDCDYSVTKQCLFGVYNNIAENFNDKNKTELLKNIEKLINLKP